MRSEFDVVIVGAGAVGSTLAALLGALEVCEPQRIALIAASLPSRNAAVAADWDLRVFALSRASERVLKLCGVWQKLPPLRRFAYERMCVWDAAGEARGDASIEFDCAALNEPNLGHIVDGLQLQAHCFERALACGVEVIEARVESLDARGVLLSNGSTLKTDLLVGADGADSPTRYLLRIGTAGHIYDQEALVAHVRTALPHGNTAWQRFTASGPVAFLPMNDGRCSIVWSNERREARRLSALDPAAFAAALGDASGGVLGACELTSPIARFPLQLQYALNYVRPGAALLGEAAHSVHPLAGQGLNIGLADAATLVDVLRARRRGDRLGDLGVLRRYERRRRGENFMAASALDGLERLFSNDNPLLARMRGFGLAAAARLPPLKREFAWRALGLAGDVPDFLKGDRP